jgi:hypothetical protein
VPQLIAAEMGLLMLSKCINPHCSETFQYFGQGRLFRIDFSEARRKSAQAGKAVVASIRSKTYPIEHFWLCEKCAATMTIEFSEAGEIRVLPIETSKKNPSTMPRPTGKAREASA